MPDRAFEEWIMLCVSDYAAQVRGKGFSAKDREKHLKHGIGIAPTSLMITAFGEIIKSPWGPRNEILMRPALETETHIPSLNEGHVPERFILADLTELNGDDWPGCPRIWLAQALKALKDEAGLQLFGAFEHEFHFEGQEQRRGDAYLQDAMRLAGAFPGALLKVLRDNGIEPELFHPEYGPSQFEVSCKARHGVTIADDAVRLREIARGVARAFGHRAVFTPLLAPNLVGNGTHIHFSLQNLEGRPVSYDPQAPHHISKVAAPFVAGVLKYMPAITALTAPSAISYQRLQPNRWSASYNNLGVLDREAGVRICPLIDLPGSNPQTAFNFEFRACDGTANPYLALGALVWSGLQGIRDKLAPPLPTTGDPEALSEEEKAQHKLEHLPQSLEEAMSRLAGEPQVQDWMGPVLSEAYRVHKESELAVLEGKTLEEQCRYYLESY
ncbi:MAG: glutamine synthetase family protein [Pseudomonadota bacterium]